MSHLILDIYFYENKIHPSLYDLKYGNDLIYTLTKLNNHKLIQKPTIIQFPTPPNFNVKGYTGFGVLMESHISIHTYPEKNKLSMDIYSCNSINYKKNLLFLKRLFNNNNKIHYKFFTRD